jgi:hypothetical protein
MKAIASLQIAVFVSAGYRNTPNTWTFVGNSANPSNNSLSITVTNWADENGDILYMNICENMLISNPLDN